MGGAVEENPEPLTWGQWALRFAGFFAGFWFFLAGIFLLQDSIQVLGGKYSNLFGFAENPIMGLMVGVLVTVLVQSSSTSTSIIVVLVGAGQITVREGIPLVMGANIGTSVTSTLVAMGHMASRNELELSFAGATVHDMFNLLAVLCLFPLEMLFHPIETCAGLLAGGNSGNGGGENVNKQFDWLKPQNLLRITPFTNSILKKNKDLTKAAGLGVPEITGEDCVIPATSAVSSLLALLTSTACDGGSVQSYYCVAADKVKIFGKAAGKDTLAAYGCSNFTFGIAAPVCPVDTSCYLNIDVFYKDEISNGQYISEGFTQRLGNELGGLVGLLLSFVFFIGGLLLLVKCLQGLILGKAKDAIKRATDLNGYVAMVVGAVVTLACQSSSITTSLLVPLVGIGVLPLPKMFPVTLGANIGTTGTGLITALAESSEASLTIALCHLLFNIFGIAIWFPIPTLRNVPIHGAEVLGMYASFFKWVPLAYIIAVFVVLPLVALGWNLIYQASAAAGIFSGVVILGAFGGVVFWWNYMGGAYRLVSAEERGAREREKEDAVEFIMTKQMSEKPRLDTQLADKITESP